MAKFPTLLGSTAINDVQGKTDRDFFDNLPMYAARPGMVVFGWVTWLIFALFLYLMPNYVGYLNKHYARTTCVTPTWDLIKYHNTSCLDGSDLTELARAAGRFNWRGEPTACGCTEGIFGEDICVLGSLAGNKVSGHTVSHYIGTTTGISAFSILSIGPIAVAWIYGTGDSEMLRCLGCADRTTVGKWIKIGSKLSLALFQVAYLLFECTTDCVWSWWHTMLPPVFAILGIIHYTLVAVGALRRKQWAPLAIVATAVLTFIICDVLFNMWGHWHKECVVEPGTSKLFGPTVTPWCKRVFANRFTPFYFEASLLVSIFWIGPALCTWAAWTQRTRARSFSDQSIGHAGLYSFLYNVQGDPEDLSAHIGGLE